MKVEFVGTRGYIKARTRRHKRHTVTLVKYRKFRLLIDCGIDWLGKIDEVQPHAIVITHAHPDHAWGLQAGAPCPVYASKASWDLMADYPIQDAYELTIEKKVTIGPFQVTPFFAVHSLLAPAVGYKIAAGNKTIFVAHDIISIEHRTKALRGVDVYIGDGATITRPFIRRKNSKIFGHTTIRAQIGWCKKEGVPRAIFTHCGSEIVEGDERVLGALVRKIGRERGVDARIAYDGLEVTV